MITPPLPSEHLKHGLMIGFCLSRVDPRRNPMPTPCEHLEGLTPADFPPPRTPGACEECLAVAATTHRDATPQHILGRHSTR